MSKTEIDKIFDALNEITHKKDMVSVVQNDADDMVGEALFNIDKEDFKATLKPKQLNSFEEIENININIADVIVKIRSNKVLSVEEMALISSYVIKQDDSLVVNKHIRLDLLQNEFLESWAKLTRKTPSQIIRDLIVEKCILWANGNLNIGEK